MSAVSVARRPARVGTPRWPALRAVLRRIRELFPLTGVGLIVLAGSLVAWLYFGVRRLDLILLVVGVVGSMLVLIGLLATLVAAVIIKVTVSGRNRPDMLELECGYPARTGFSLPNPWFLPFVDLRWSWVQPAAEIVVRKDRGRLEEYVVAARRGVYDQVERRFEIGDIFGLTSFTFRAEERRPVRFTPSVGNLKHIEVIRGMSGGDDISHPDGPPEGDPFDMRRYNPGDPIKFVLWKVFAKSRTLVVRTPERAISPARQTVAYLVASDGDEPAAGAARVAVDGGALGQDWTLGADGSDTVAKSRQQAVDLLTRSADSPTNQAGSGLGRFLKESSVGNVGRAVVFLPPTPGPWLDRVAQSTSDRAGRIEFVICTDGIQRRPPATVWQKLMGRVPDVETDPRLPGAMPPADADDLAEIVRRLGGSRSKVLIVDRVAGKVFTTSHLESAGIT